MAQFYHEFRKYTFHEGIDLRLGPGGRRLGIDRPELRATFIHHKLVAGKTPRFSVCYQVEAFREQVPEHDSSTHKPRIMIKFYAVSLTVGPGGLSIRFMRLRRRCRYGPLG